FYYNPFKLIKLGYKGLFPPYLIVIEICIIILFILLIKFDCVNLSFFDISDYLGLSITGLSFTLAIFVAVNNLFTTEELSILASYKEENDKVAGRTLYELLAPFGFTSMIFLITGLCSLIFPAITVEIPVFLWKILVTIFLCIFSLGLLSLFNLTNSLLNHIYHKAYRNSER